MSEGAGLQFSFQGEGLVIPPKPVTYYIWSHRHSEWWGPERAGYTLSLNEAGVYSAEEAADIVLSGLPGSKVAVDTQLASRLPISATAIEEKLEELRRL